MRVLSITDASLRCHFYRFHDLHQCEQRKQVTLHGHSNFVVVNFKNSGKKLIASNDIHFLYIRYKALHPLEYE